MSFDDGSDRPNDQRHSQQLNSFAGSANYEEADDMRDSESPEIIEDDGSDLESLGNEDEEGEQSEEALSDESHPEAAKAMRALQKYRGDEEEPNASDYYSEEENDEEDEASENDQLGRGSEEPLAPNQHSSLQQRHPSQHQPLEPHQFASHHHQQQNQRPQYESLPQPHLADPQFNQGFNQPQAVDNVSLTNTTNVEGVPAAQPYLPNGDDTLVRNLKAEIKEVEATYRELQRQIHQAQLQAESARAAQERQALAASQNAEELRRVRALSAQEKSKVDAQIAALKADANLLKVEADAKERSYHALRDRFNQQSTALAEVRAQVAELQREHVQFDMQVVQATRAEARAQKQIDQLREELSLALDEAAQARAELELQTSTMSDIRAKAREEALSALADDLSETSNIGASKSNEESIWRQQYVALRRQMDSVAAEFERREPEILALQEAHELAESRAAKAIEDLAVETKARKDLERKWRSSERRISDLTVQQQLTESTLSDLRRQLLVLLTEKLLGSTNEDRLSPEEEDELARLREEVARSEDNANRGEYSGQDLINERLLLFKDVAELQFQNEALLKACRELASQLDPSGDATAAALAVAHSTTSEDLHAAAEALETLQSKYKQLRDELNTSLSNEARATQTASEKVSENESLKARVQSLQEQLRDARKRFTESSMMLNSQSDTSATGSVVKNSEEELLRLQIKNAESRIQDLQIEAAQLRAEHREISQRFAAAQLALGRAEERASAAETRAAEIDAQCTTLNHELSVLNSERNLWGEREQQLLAQVVNLQTDLESAQGHLGRNHESQEGLQALLLEQVGKIEALVASKSGGAGATESVQMREELEKAEQARQQAVDQLEAANQKAADLHHQVSLLEEQVNDLRSELQEKVQNFESQQSVWNTTKAKLDAEFDSLRANNEQLQATITEQNAESQRQKERANARDEELVEQVNDLEDQLTEARLQAESMRQNEPQLRDRLTQEITQELTQKLSEELQAQIREEVQREAQPQPLAPAGDKQAGSSLTENLEEPQALAELRSRLEEQLRPEIEQRLNAELHKSLSESLRESLRPEVETNLKSELTDKISSELREELTDKIRSEVQSSGSGFTSQQPSSAPSNDTAPSDSILANDVPTETSELSISDMRQQLESAAQPELVSKFENAVLLEERTRVRDAFKQKLSAVRVEAEQKGEALATKRAEIRSKLQNQKLTKLEQTNKDLEAKIEDLRNKVRRLKGGATPVETEEVEKPQNSQDSQSQSIPPAQSFFQMPAQSASAFRPTSSPFATFGSYFSDPQKRPGSFDDTNAKKRKEEDQ